MTIVDALQLLEFMLLIVLPLAWLVWSMLLGHIAATRGKPFKAFFWFAPILSPAAVAVWLALEPISQDVLDDMAVVGGTRKRCLSCNEAVRGQAACCRYCTAELARTEPIKQVSAVAAPGRRRTRWVLMPRSVFWGTRDHSRGEKQSRAAHEAFEGGGRRYIYAEEDRYAE